MEVKCGDTTAMRFRRTWLYYRVRCADCKWSKTLERGGSKGQPVTKAKREQLQQKLKEHWIRMHEKAGPGDGSLVRKVERDG